MATEIKLSQQARDRFSQRGRHQRTEQAAGQEQTAAKDKNSDALMAEMQQNPYFQIVYSTALSDPEKLATLKQRLKYDLEKDGAENQKSIEMLVNLDRALQLIRFKLGDEMVALHENPVYSEMKMSLDQVCQKFVEYDGNLKPLVSILQDIRKVRSDGNTVDAIKSVQARREQDELEKRKIAELRTQLETINQNVKSIAVQMASHREGVLPLWLRGGDKAAIAALEVEQVHKIVAAERLGKEITEAIAAIDERQKALESSEGYQKQKVVENMIDIGTEAYMEKIKGIAGTAKEFMGFAKVNLTTVIDRLETVGKQIDKSTAMNAMLLRGYTIISQACKESLMDNKDILVSVGGNPDAENADAIPQTRSGILSVEDLERQEHVAGLQAFITSLQHSATNAVEVYGGLQTQEAVLLNMKRQNQTAIVGTNRQLNAGMATAVTRIGTVISAIEQAAAKEQGALVGNIFDQVQRDSEAILSGLFEDAVTDVKSGNQRIADMIGRMDDLGAIVLDTNEQLLDGLSETRKLIQDAEESAKALGEVSAQSRGLEAQALIREGKTPEAGTTPRNDNKRGGAAAPNPFGALTA